MIALGRVQQTDADTRIDNHQTPSAGSFGSECKRPVAQTIIKKHPRDPLAAFIEDARSRRRCLQTIRGILWLRSHSPGRADNGTQLSSHSGLNSTHQKQKLRKHPRDPLAAFPSNARSRRRCLPNTRGILWQHHLLTPGRADNTF